MRFLLILSLRMNQSTSLTKLSCLYYREKCKVGLAYGMGFRSHVTYLLGNSLLKRWISCYIYFPITQHLEPAILIDSLVEEVVAFGPPILVSHMA